jgi:competence protein ComEC
MIKRTVLSLLIFFVLSAGPARARDELLKVHFIDVGYGDSMLVQTPEEKNILIDGGDESSGKKVAKYVKKQKVKKLDIVFVTHYHDDHLEGLFYVVKKIKASRVISNLDVSKYNGYFLFYKLLEEKGVPYSVMKKGEKIKDIGGVSISAFNPDVFSGNANNDSLVLKIVYGQTSFLMPGDIGQARCESLAEEYKDALKADVLKSPHHGKSGMGIFLDNVMPDIVVVSTGVSEWGWPYKEVLDGYKERNIKVFRTDEDGTVVIVSDGRNVWRQK